MAPLCRTPYIIQRYPFFNVFKDGLGARLYPNSQLLHARFFHGFEKFIVNKVCPGAGGPF